MADPLTILRGILVEGSTPTIEGDDFVLGRYKFNKNTPTAFKGSTGSNYTLGTVYFLHSNRTLNHGAYILAASRSNVQAVAFNDKKELLQYLDGGEISSSIIFDSLPAAQNATLLDGSEIGSMQTDQQSSTQLPQQTDQPLQSNTLSSLSTTTITTTSASSTITSNQVPITQKELDQLQQQSQQQPQQPQQQQEQQQQQPQQQQQQQQEQNLQDDEYNNFDQYQDMAIQDFDEMDKLNYKTDSQNKVNPLLVNDKEYTAQQLNDKNLFAEKIDSKRIKPEIALQTEDTYLEDISKKRKNPTESSSFIIADQDVTKAINEREKKSSDKVSVLQSTVSFKNILDNFKKFKSEEEEEKRRRSRPSSSSSSSNGNVKPSNGSPSIVPSNLKNRTPIIIVPSSLTSPISLFNVLEFLQNSSFRPTLEKKQEMASQNIMKPPMITFDRITSQKVTYEIIDNIKNLKPEDWHRVAAAFVQGEAWQFKDWKWNSPTDLFANIRGFYVKFDDSNTPDVVKSWDVKILHISKSKRHLDQTAQVEFWNSFDEFVNFKKPYLNH